MNRFAFVVNFLLVVLMSASMASVAFAQTGPEDQVAFQSSDRMGIVGDIQSIFVSAGGNATKPLVLTKGYTYLIDRFLQTNSGVTYAFSGPRIIQFPMDLKVPTLRDLDADGKPIIRYSEPFLYTASGFASFEDGALKFRFPEEGARPTRVSVQGNQLSSQRVDVNGVELYRAQCEQILNHITGREFCRTSNGVVEPNTTAGVEYRGAKVRWGNENPVAMAFHGADLFVLTAGSVPGAGKLIVIGATRQDTQPEKVLVNGLGIDPDSHHSSLAVGNHGVYVLTGSGNRMEILQYNFQTKSFAHPYVGYPGETIRALTVLTQ